MKIKFALLFTLLILIFTINTFSQLKIVTKTEYDELDIYKKNTANLSRIVTNTRKQYKDKKVIKSVKIVQRFESIERNDWTIYETVDGETKKTLEIVYYDGQEFRRENHGQWKDMTRSSGNGMGGGMGISGKEAEKLEQYAIADFKFKEKPVRIFSYFRVYKIGQRLNFYDSIKYIDAEDKIVYEKYYISDIHPEFITEMSETTYEYEPEGIKIEVPTVKPSEK